MKSKDQKRQEAEARNLEYSKLSVEQKLSRLPKSGADKQKNKLMKQLNTGK